jgi:hypothetical protein
VECSWYVPLSVNVDVSVCVSVAWKSTSRTEVVGYISFAVVLLRAGIYDSNLELALTLAIHLSLHPESPPSEIHLSYFYVHSVSS